MRSSGPLYYLGHFFFAVLAIPGWMGGILIFVWNQITINFVLKNGNEYMIKPLVSLIFSIFSHKVSTYYVQCSRIHRGSAMISK